MAKFVIHGIKKGREERTKGRENPTRSAGCAKIICMFDRIELQTS
jgi:hypothetical protein